MCIKHEWYGSLSLDQNKFLQAKSFGDYKNIHSGLRCTVVLIQIQTAKVSNL